MQKVGWWRDPLFIQYIDSRSCQPNLGALHLSLQLREGQVASWLFIFLLSRASAKLQLPQPLNKFIEIQIQNLLATNNELYQSTKSATWRPSLGPRWFYTTIDKLYDSVMESSLFNWTISWINRASMTIQIWFTQVSSRPYIEVILVKASFFQKLLKDTK